MTELRPEVSNLLGVDPVDFADVTRIFADSVDKVPTELNPDTFLRDLQAQAAHTFTNLIVNYNVPFADLKAMTLARAKIKKEKTDD